MRSRYVARLLMLIGLLLGLQSFEIIAATTRYIDPLCGEISTYNPGAVGAARCSGGSATSKPSFVGSISIMAAGDILYVRGSTTSTPTVYANRLANPPSGTGASGRTVISAYPINRTCSGHNPADVTTCIGSTYENVLLKPTASPVIDIRGAGASPGPARDPKWITIEGIRVDASASGGKGITITGGGALPTNYPTCDNGSKGYATTPDNLRFLNLEVCCSPSSGYLGDIYNQNIEIIGSWFWDNGHDLGKDHGIYMGGSNNWVYGNLIEKNRTYGIHNYGQPVGTPANPGCNPFPSGTIIESNIVRGNRSGIGALRGHQGQIIRNNLVYGHAELGIHVTWGLGTANKVYNNTTYGNILQGLLIGENGDGTIYTNNILDGLFVDPAATGTSGNSNFNGTPNFIDTASGDFRLRAGDARIDAGTNLTSEGVTKDFAGNARPNGSGFDIGAYEFGASGPPVQTFDFSMDHDVDPTLSMTIAQGASDDAEITLTTVSGTASNVTLTAEGLPTNATASFSDTTCTPNCTSTMTIDTANTTPEGTYTVTVRGRTGESIGSIQRTTSFTLIVTCN